MKDMSARNVQQAPIRLLIAEKTENAAHQFDSLLRDAGIATRLEIIELPMALDKLPDADLLLCNAAVPELAHLLPRLSKLAPWVPILVVNNDEAALGQAEGMELGAADVVSDTDTEHLVLVAQRELAHVAQNHALKRAQRALDEAERRCQLLLQSSRAAIAYVHEGMHIYANEGYLNLFGFEDADELLGLPLIDLLDGDSGSALKGALKKFRRSEDETGFDFVGHSTGGDVIRGSMTLAPSEYEGEQCLQVTVRAEVSTDADAGVPVLQDAELDDATDADAAAPAEEFELELEEAEPAAAQPTAEVLEFAAQNREPEAAGQAGRAPARGLTDFLARAEVQAADWDGQFVSVFVAQIDGYEGMQRTHGLAGAEEACRLVEQKLLDEVDGTFLQISPYQWGFLVCETTREDALGKVEGYRSAIESMMFEIREKTIRPSCTFGGAILNASDFDSMNAALEATLNNAFTTLRTTLESHDGNTIELPNFDNAEQLHDDETNRVLSLISDAIEKQSFLLLFQPIISLRGDSEEHYEVFLRMHDRDGAQMTPDKFLKLAADSGVAGKIDRWVILQSIKTLSAHRGNGHNTRLTINLSSNSIADPEFIQWLGVAIKAARLPSDAVIFQITEQDAANYVRQSKEFVEGLKNLHCRSSLSRFGLDSEPMEVLSHLPVDIVKLDGSLVEGVDSDEERREAVTELVKALQSQGKLTVAPMVESASLLSTLWQAGVNYIQGHYLQEPSAVMDYDFSTDD
jgi:EAL domain-containing protein (putative c-di-GMP-specific phosphodiesterase class I)/PAS domain-containing protein